MNGASGQLTVFSGDNLNGSLDGRSLVIQLYTPKSDFKILLRKNFPKIQKSFPINKDLEKNCCQQPLLRKNCQKPLEKISSILGLIAYKNTITLSDSSKGFQQLKNQDSIYSL